MGIQRIKLWEDTLSFFNLDHKKLERIRPELNKYILTRNNLSLAKSISPISSIYILYSEDEFKANKKNIEKIKVEKEITKFFLLRNNIYRPRFVKGLGKESFFFSQLSKISKTFSVFLLPLPKGISNMESFLLNALDDHSLKV